MIIEKNMPIPSVNRVGRPPKYDFSKMEVGDSVFFDGEVTTIGSSPYQSSKTYQRKSGKTFSARIMDGGLRIWRIA